MSPRGKMGTKPEAEEITLGAFPFNHDDIVHDHHRVACISLSLKMLKFLDKTRAMIVNDEGEPIRRSHLVEDALFWVFSDEKRMTAFLDELYPEADSDD